MNTGKIDDGTAHDNTQIRRHLTKALKQELGNSDNLKSRLIARIEEANGYAPGMTIERRKLVSLLDSDHPVKLSTLELQALDTFFHKVYRGGLSGILKPSNILQLVANTGRIAFLVGAKPSENGTNSVSSWDLRSVMHLMRSMDSVTSGVHFDIHDVLLRTPTQLASSPTQTFRKEAWYDLIFRQNGPSLICLGSPRANHSSGCLLAEMTGFLPFTMYDQAEGNHTGAPDDKPPFQFAWRPDGVSHLASSFVVPLSEMTKTPDQESKYYAAIRIGREEAYRVAYRSERRTEYGIVACQRRYNGRILVCISGLTGPSTFAVAQELSFTALELPQTEPPQALPVHWILFKTEVSVGNEMAGDARQITECAQVKSGIWRPSTMAHL